MSRETAEEFRKDIKEKHPIIFESLIEYMTEGPCLALLLEGKDAIKKSRRLCGPTNPDEAEKGTIRGDFAKGDMKELYLQGKAVRNVIHSSETAEAADREARLILGVELIAGGNR